MPSPSKMERQRKRYCQKFGKDFESDREKLIQSMKAKHKAEKSKLEDEIAKLKITNTVVTEQRDLLSEQITSIQLGLALELGIIGFTVVGSPEPQLEYSVTWQKHSVVFDF